MSKKWVNKLTPSLSSFLAMAGPFSVGLDYGLLSSQVILCLNKKTQWARMNPNFSLSPKRSFIASMISLDFLINHNT